MTPARDADLYRAPKGTLDVLPPESARWEYLIARFAARTERYGYGLVVSPMFEHVEVFQRVGESTDVVRKEMYVFEDQGGRRYALRPEGTASVVRTYVEHRPTPPWKVWYVSPFFRAERPQKGRYRQHVQLGVEAIGTDDPDVDVEVIALLHGFYRDLGLQRFRLQINSMGDAESREHYREVLLAYWRAHADLLGDEMERAELNPLRILDSKRPDWQATIDAAPKLAEYLTPAAIDAFARVQAGLTALGIAFEINPRLVRGFDYYTGTVFEFASDALDSAQNAIGGGGRYNKLSEEMGGPEAPAIGFGAGIERLLMACTEEGVCPAPTSRTDVFVVDTIGNLEAVTLLEELRSAGVRADRAYGGRSLKAQMKVADKSGAPVVLILGEHEAARGCVSWKDLRTGEQTEVPRAEAAARAVAFLHDAATRGVLS
ncbi:MAG: histidine--tRNA ligase [Acidimicrobiia bacterium]